MTIPTPRPPRDDEFDPDTTRAVDQALAVAGKACPFCHAVDGHTLVPHPGIRHGGVPAGTLTRCPNETIEHGRLVRVTPTPAERFARRQAERSPRTAFGAALVALMGLLFVALIVVIVDAWLFAPAAHASGGSDSPVPYTLTRDGIDFPEPLAAHGHVNVRTTTGAQYSLHLDPNNERPGAVWFGSTSLPWSALGVPATACVAWVQWSGSDAHYGEGGQPPYCLTTPNPTSTPEPTWSPTPTPSSTPSTTSTPTPAPTSSPSPSTPGTPPTPSPTSRPSSPPSAPPSSTPAPPATASPSATPGGPSSAPSPTTATPAHAPLERAEVSAAVDDDEHAEVLAATGTDPVALGLGAIALILAGWQLVQLVRDERARRAAARAHEDGADL